MFYFPTSIISLLGTGNDDDKDFLMLGIKLEQCNNYIRLFFFKKKKSLFLN